MIGINYGELQRGWYNYWWGVDPAENTDVLPSYIYVQQELIDEELVWTWTHGDDPPQFLNQSILGNIQWHGAELGL